MIDKQDICPISHADDAYVFLSLPNVPVHCNVLWPTREGALNAPRGDITLAFSPHSGHVWNTTFDPALMEYTQQYENSLHFSPRFQQFAEELAQRLIAQFDMRNKDIVEIGSGKGEFLAMLCEMGNNRGYGYDPSYVPDPTLEQAGGRITFVQDMYTEKYTDQQADLICCRHVLEHIQVPADMLLSVRKAIGDQRTTVVYFEMPNVLFMLRDLSVWDIIYEHCSYFSAGSLAYAFAESGFDTLEVREEFGGQFLSITALPARNDMEAQRVPWHGLEQMGDYVDAFAEHYRGKIATWRERLSALEQAGKKVVIWGAGSKGVTFLNTLQTHKQVTYAVDINPRKQGMYVAGTGQEIVSPEFLRDYQPDAVILMNPIYREEVQRTLDKIGVQADILPV
jgi:hypothetical protein